MCTRVCGWMVGCWCMPGKTHDQHDKNATPFMSSYLLACSLCISTYFFRHTPIRCLSLVFVVLLVLEWLRVSFFSPALLLHFSLFVCIVTVFCPEISYQLVITIAYLNHSYLPVKSLVNFEFSLLLVLQLVKRVYVNVCYVFVCSFTESVSPYNVRLQRGQICSVTDNFFVRLISSKSVSCALSLP